MPRAIIAHHIYHTLNRGVDKRKIFLDDADRYRFVHDLFEFNDTEPADKVFSDIASPNINRERKPRKLLVDILAFCLMPNHYHLLLKPRTDEGLTLFMKKLNIGYAKYFNERYERSGTLFQGRFKAIEIQRDAHFTYIPYYIHLNPLDMFSPEWREQKLRNFTGALRFLESYRWSSHLDYLGRKNFPSVTQREFLLECFGGNDSYEREMKSWLKDLDLETIRSNILE